MASIGASAGVAKVLVVGNVATGKTSIIRRYTRNEFSSDYQTTIGVDFSLKSLTTDGVDINVQLWDIAGQERFAGLSRIFYTHAVGAIVVFDIWDRETFNNAAMWKKDIDAKVFFPNGEKIPVILLANKCDLISESQQPSITSEQIDEFCRKHDFIASYQVSAKTGANIKEACLFLISRIVQNNKRMKALSQTPSNNTTSASTSPSSSNESQSPNAQTSQPIKLKQEPIVEPKGGCC